MARFQDISGQKYGHLTAIMRLENGNWLWKCDCGNETEAKLSTVKCGNTSTCGRLCDYSPSRCDLTGQRFGRLVALRRAENLSGNRTAWLCRCDCGNEKVIGTQPLRSGAVKSCGCLHREVAREHLLSISETHGESDTRLYRIWLAMRRRCNNPHCDAYKHYGARGIKVCDEWADFVAFRDWANENGYDENAPKNLCTLDRIDVDGDYCADNCRWVTQSQQMRNTRTNHLVEYQGNTMTIADLADLTGIPYQKLQPRITVNGWDAERAVNTPFPSQRK